MCSIQNESRSTARRSLDRLVNGSKPRPHSMHLEFDDMAIQLIRLRQENAELKESLRLERKESTKLRALNDELAHKLELCRREREAKEQEASSKPKVRFNDDTRHTALQRFIFYLNNCFDCFFSLQRSKFAAIVDVLQLKFKNRPPKETLKQKHIFESERSDIGNECDVWGGG